MPKKHSDFEMMRDAIAEENPEALMADGFEDALIGLVRIYHKTLALYDRTKCIEILMKRDGMSHEDAEEYFEFNTQGAWVGEGTPGFAVMKKDFHM